MCLISECHIVSEYFNKTCKITDKFFHNRNRRQQKLGKKKINAFETSHKVTRSSSFKEHQGEEETPLHQLNNSSWSLCHVMESQTGTCNTRMYRKSCCCQADRMTCRIWDFTQNEMCSCGHSHSRQMNSPYKCRKRQLGWSQHWDDWLIRGEIREKAT